MLQDRRSRFVESGMLMSATDDGASRLGDELRAARQRLGWDLPGVAAGLRIRLSFLEAMEDGRVADLPDATYAVGFLRTYASALGLDADEIARRFRAETKAVARKPELAFPAPVPERGVPPMVVVLLGLVLAGGAYAGWYRMTGTRTTPVETTAPVPDRLAPLADHALQPSTPSPQVASVMPVPGPMPSVPGLPAPPAVVAPAPAPAPVVVAPPPPPPAPAAPAVPEARIVLRARADSWMQVRERQGAVLLNRVLHAGESWPVPQRAQLLLTTGNAAGTELVVDGQPGPSLGQGGVRRDIVLDADALKRGQLQPAAPRAAPRPAPASPSTDTGQGL